jgi:Tfp pilus assembly protein PilO
VTARDRIIIVGVLVLAALGAFWFVGLAPKRKEAADLRTKITAASQKLVQAQQTAAQAQDAKAHYNGDYAEVASLGKAVPKSDAMPSLVYQLQSAAHDARIDFKSLKVAGGGTQATPPAAAASTSKTAKNAGASESSPSTAAPATQAGSASLPPGAAVGSAGFPTMPFSFIFNGSFVDMQQFLSEVQRFVRVDGKSIDVRGRLLSVDGFSLGAGPGGFPNVTANITATAYLLSPDDTGATPASSGSSSAGGGVSTSPPLAATGVTQ